MNYLIVGFLICFSMYVLIAFSLVYRRGGLLALKNAFVGDMRKNQTDETEDFFINEYEWYRYEADNYEFESIIDDSDYQPHND